MYFINLTHDYSQRTLQTASGYHPLPNVPNIFQDRHEEELWPSFSTIKISPKELGIWVGKSDGSLYVSFDRALGSQTFVQTWFWVCLGVFEDKIIMGISHWVERMALLVSILPSLKGTEALGRGFRNVMSKEGYFLQILFCPNLNDKSKGCTHRPSVHTS